MGIRKLINKEISCETTQEIFELSLENQDELVKRYDGKEIFQAHLHLSKCTDCVNFFKKLVKGRVQPDS